MLDIRTGNVTNDAIQFADEGLCIIKMKDGAIVFLDEEEDMLANIDDINTLSAFIKALQYAVKNDWLEQGEDE